MLNLINKNQVLRYLMVGATAFAIEYGLFFILYVIFEWHLLIANSLSFVAGLCASFLLNRVWAFKKTEFERAVHHQALIYSILATANLFISNIMITFLKNVGLDPRLGKIAAA